MSISSWREAAECRHVLVLFADGLLQHVELNVAGLFGQSLQRHRAQQVRSNGAQQSDQVATRRAESCAGRQIGDGSDLDGVVNAVRPQRFAREFVLELIDVRDGLALRVVQADEAVGIGHVQDHVHVLVDGHSQHEAAVLFVEAGQIGAASTERDAERSAGNNHREGEEAPRAMLVRPSIHRVGGLGASVLRV